MLTGTCKHGILLLVREGKQKRYELEDEKNKNVLNDYAWVAESVDARDLKSRVLCGRAGSSPALGTILKRKSIPRDRAVW